MFISAVESILHSLPCLNRIDIRESDHHDTHDDDALDHEFEIVRRWGDRAPYLRYVALPGSANWIRSREVWFPCVVGLRFTPKVNFKWFFNAVVTIPGLPPPYAQFAQLFAESDVLLAVKAALENGEDVDFILNPGGGILVEN